MLYLTHDLKLRNGKQNITAWVTLARHRSGVQNVTASVTLARQMLAVVEIERKNLARAITNLGERIVLKFGLHTILLFISLDPHPLCILFMSTSFICCQLFCTVCFIYQHILGRLCLVRRISDNTIKTVVCLRNIWFIITHGSTEIVNIPYLFIYIYNFCHTIITNNNKVTTNWD